MKNNCIQQEADSIDYDYENDSLFFFTKGAGYKQSLDLDNVIIDFDEHNHIKGVEILDASERFGVSKFAIKNPEKINIQLNVSEKKIELSINIILQIRNQEIPRAISAIGTNLSNIPPGTMAMSV